MKIVEGVLSSSSESKHSAVVEVLHSQEVDSVAKGIRIKSIQAIGSNDTETTYQYSASVFNQGLNGQDITDLEAIVAEVGISADRYVVSKLLQLLHHHGFQR